VPERMSSQLPAPSFIMVKKLALTTDDPFNKADAVLSHEGRISVAVHGIY